MFLSAQAEDLRKKLDEAKRAAEKPAAKKIPVLAFFFASNSPSRRAGAILLPARSS